MSNDIQASFSSLCTAFEKLFSLRCPDMATHFRLRFFSPRSFRVSPYFTDGLLMGGQHMGMFTFLPMVASPFCLFQISWSVLLFSYARRRTPSGSVSLQPAEPGACNRALLCSLMLGSFSQYYQLLFIFLFF